MKNYIELKEEIKKEKDKLKELKEKYSSEIEFVESLNKEINNKDVDSSIKIEALNKYRKENPIYDEYHKLSFHIKCLEDELNEVIDVGMDNRFHMTSFEKPIIKTDSIYSCIGVLVYLEYYKVAYLGHFSSNKYGGIEDEDANRIYDEIENELRIFPILGRAKYLVVPGINTNVNRINIVAQKLSEKLNLKMQLFLNIPKSAVRINNDFNTLEFAFDANSGEFVTDLVFSNDIDYKINNASYEKSK